MGWSLMKSRTKINKPQKEAKQQDDDVWTWVVIGLIFAGVTLALYGPLIWATTHNTL